MSEQKLHGSSIHAGGEGIQDQVILPFSIAFGICMRGIKTRLGRSVVTLLGVSLGITFLMAVISGFHIKGAMGQEAERMRITERRIAMLRGEVGSLGKRKVLVFACQPDDMAVRFIATLATVHNAQVRLVTDGSPLKASGVEVASLPADLPREKDGCSAVVALGDYAALPAFQKNLEQFKDMTLPVVALPAAELAAKLKDLGVRAKLLDVELRPDEIQEQHRRDAEAKQRMWWIVGVSLMITVIGIANAMLMSVTERIREIGTMKCLGALSSFVVKLFLIESSLLGFIGSVLGALAGVVFSVLTYAATFGMGNILTSVNYPLLLLCGVGSVVAGVILAIIAAIYPALVAARMIPAVALTSNV